MKQDNYAELSGSSLLNTPHKKKQKMGGVKQDIQIIGNPRNTKKRNNETCWLAIWVFTFLFLN